MTLKNPVVLKSLNKLPIYVVSATVSVESSLK
jgi:hypothetical protein